MALPPIIDPHIHLWSPTSTPRRVTPLARLLGWWPAAMRTVASVAFPRSALDFVGRSDFVAADYLPEHYWRDAAELGIEGVVHIEAGWYEAGPLGVAGETRWLHGLHDDGLILGIVGAANLGSPDLDAKLDAHQAASPRFRGIRDKLATSPHRGVEDWADQTDLLQQEAWQRGYGRLGERGLSFDAWLYAPQLAAMYEVASAYPDTQLVIDHVGAPIGLGGPFGGLSETERADIEARWREDLARLATLPHVHLKLSGLTMPLIGWGLHDGRDVIVDDLTDRLGPPLRYALEQFGPERCMFASNFPIDKVSTSLATLYGAFDQISSDLPDEARAQLFSGTARRFYRL